MTVLESLFIPTQNDMGPKYSPTLAHWTSVLFPILSVFSVPRNSTFTFVGVDIDETPDNSTHYWFPNSGIPIGDLENRSPTHYHPIGWTPKARISRIRKMATCARMRAYDRPLEQKNCTRAATKRS